MRTCVCLSLLLLSHLAGCGGDENPTHPQDTTPPKTVDDLGATSLGSSAIRLTWTAPGDDADVGAASEYDIRYSASHLQGDAWQNAAPVPETPSPRIAGTGETFTVDGLSETDSLFFCLRTADEIPNWSEWSNACGSLLDGVSPASITNLSAAARADSAILLTWMATGDDGQSGQADRYDIRYSDYPEATWQEMIQVSTEPIPPASGQADSTLVYPLHSGQSYWFRMKVGDEIPNWSHVSNTTSADPAVPPDPISDLSVTSTTAHTATLEWTASGDDAQEGTATAYDIRLSSSGETSWDSMVEYPGPEPQSSGRPEAFVIEGLTADTDYIFRIQVEDDAGNRSAVSVPAHSKTQDVIAPAPVTDLSVQGLGPTHVSLRWSCTGDNGMEGVATEFDLRYRLDYITEANWDEAQTVVVLPDPASPGSPMVADVTALSDDTAYWFAIRVADEALNWSSLSNVVQADLPDGTPPQQVTDLLAEALSTTRIRLSWTAPGDDGNAGTASQYDIRYSTVLISEYNWSTATPVPETPIPEVSGSVQDTEVINLDEDVHYFFRMQVADEVPNWSIRSNLATERTLDGTPPATIADLRVAETTETTATLEWTAPGDNGTIGHASQYDIRYSTAGLNETTWDAALQIEGEPSPSGPGITQSFTVTGLQPCTSYELAMKSHDEVPNTSSISNVVEAYTSEPSSLHLEGRVDTPCDAIRVATSGDIVYVAGGRPCGVEIIDVSDPTSPEIVGNFSSGGDLGVSALDVQDTYMYVGEAGHGATAPSYLHVVSISDPTSPVLVGSVDVPGSPTGVVVDGPITYVSTYHSGLFIVDTSIPGAPEVLGSVDTYGEPRDLYIDGDYAYVADFFGDLKIINVTDPTTPFVAATLNTPGYAIGVIVSAGFAYVADRYSGLQIVDISSPESPVIIGNIDTSDEAWHTVLIDNYAYVADGYSGVSIVDVTVASNPTLIDIVDTPGRAKGITFDEYLFVADGSEGLTVFSLPCTQRR